MAYNSLGEWKGLKEKLNGSLGNIAESLKALLEQQTEMNWRRTSEENERQVKKIMISYSVLFMQNNLSFKPKDVI